jgi:hypothetical protein
MNWKYFMISSFMILAMLITISCQNDEIVGPVQKENTIFGNKEIMKLEVKNIGEIHNQILAAFDNEHDLLSGDKLSSEEFISLSMKSINKVLKQQDIPVEAERNDIIFVLSIFAEIREQGVYDFFSDSEEKLRDVEPLFHYLEENMGLNKKSSARCLRIANNMKKDPESKMLTQNEEVSLNDDKYAKSFSEILHYSHDFWVTKNKNLESDFLTQKSDTLGRDSEILADAAGGVIGWLFGSAIGSIICAPVASLAITSVYAYPEYWLPPTHIGRW